MTASEPGYDDEITLAELTEKVKRFVWHQWAERGVTLRIMAIALLVGVLFAFGSRAEYSARTKILPYRSQSAASGLAGLAGLAGVRLPTGAGEQTITADLYPEVARSLDFRIAVAETPIGFSTQGRTLSTVEFFRDVNKPTLVEYLGRYTVGLPRLLLSAMRPANQPAPSFGADSSRLPTYSSQYLRLVRELDERLQVSIDRKTAVITITAMMPDPYASAALVQATSDRLMQRIIDFEARKAGEQVRFVTEQHREARARFQQSQQSLATFTDRNRGTLTAVSQIEAQRRQSEYNLALAVYQQLSTELEQARIRENQDTPVFTVLERAVVPSERSSPRRGRILLLALAAGLMAGIATVAWRDYIRTST